MELYVNPQITGFRQEVDGTIKELKIGTNKEDAYANIIEQGAGAKLENNKTATINVSTYTEPVEVLPTSGKDGMKKATITLSNIPSGSGILYCWKGDYGGSTGEVYLYSSSANPEVGDSLIVSIGESGSPGRLKTTGWTVYSETNNEITVKDGEYVYRGDDNEPVVFARYSTGDISLT
jgi:hypothetical protein